MDGRMDALHLWLFKVTAAKYELDVCLYTCLYEKLQSVWLPVFPGRYDSVVCSVSDCEPARQKQHSVTAQETLSPPIEPSVSLCRSTHTDTQRHTRLAELGVQFETVALVHRVQLLKGGKIDDLRAASTSWPWRYFRIPLFSCGFRR